MDKLISFSLELALLASNPTAYAVNIVKRLERGDADSSGSTIRTGFVVALVVALMGVITTAVMALGNRVGGAMNNVKP